MPPLGVTTGRSTQIQPKITPKLWLLLVGVNQYQDEQLPCLRYSAVDCQVLATALTSATQEQFAQKNINIYHDFAPQPPLLATVRASLQQITTKAQPQDTILFYFSGHGMLQTHTQQAFLCLADTQKDHLETTGLAVQELLQLLANSGVQNQLIWLDACHSGGMTLRGLNPTKQLVAVLQQRAAKSRGFYALLSCDTDQLSWEFPELGHGVFTYYLMRGLHGDAADAQGVISADGLYRYVYHQTLQYIDKTNQQLRLINQQKRGKGDTQLYSEYPLQTPKRIVEGIGELILGNIPAIAESLPPRIALVLEGIRGSQAALDFSKVLGDAGAFELEYLPRSGTTTAKDIRATIKTCLRSTHQSQQPKTTEPAIVLLYLRGRIEETPSGEAAFVLLDEIWLSRSWLRQQLRRSSVTQQIIILDCPLGSHSVSLQEWLEELQLDTEKGQCIIAATFPKNNSELFTQALIETLKAAKKTDGLSVAAWITQLQIHLATHTQVTPSPLHIWLSGTQGVIEIIPPSSSYHKKATLDLRICPYRGLKAFSEDDAQYFYGRESLTQQLLSQLAHKSFLAVVGASGSGKSSVVQAGLIAQLRLGKQLPGSDSWLIINIRPGTSPVEALEALGVGSREWRVGMKRQGGRGQGAGGKTFGDYQHLCFSSPSSPALREGVAASTSSHILEAMLYQGVEGFVYWLRSRPEPMVVLVVDQCEELFTLAPSEDRQRFLDLLLGAIKYAADKFKLVLTVRADFIAACLEIPALAQLLQESSVLVPPKLSDEDYRRVMLNPAEQVGLKVEPGLVEVLLQELNHSAGDLPLLEFVLEQLWEFRQAGELTLAAYKQQIGGIKGALERKAQEVYDSLDSPAQECARWIFLSLTQLGEGTEDTRRRVLKSELVVQKYPQALVERTLVALTAAKLIVVNLENEAVVEGSKGEQVDSITASGAVTIEVAHEILIRHWSTLRWWLEENRSRLRSQRQIEQSAALWQHNQQQSDFLLQGNRLAEAEEIFVKYIDELSADVQYFISACLAAREHQQREQKKRLRQAQIAVIVISVLGIAASGFGGLAYLQKQAAQLREIAALNASSQAFLLSHQQLEAVIASVKAGREIKQVFSPSPEIKLSTAATFQQAIYQSQEIHRIPGHSQQVNAVTFSPDGEILASASDDRTIKLWRQDGSLITTISGSQSRVTAIAFSPDGKLLAAADADNNIKIYDIHGQLIKIFTGQNDIVTDVSFSADSKILASASLDNTVKIWQTDGRLINSWKAHDGWVNTVNFSPDSKIIASGGEDNLVKLWQVDDGNLITTLRGHQGRITRVQFSPDNQVLASASGDKTIKIWNEQGKVLQNIEAHSEQVNSIKFSPDNQILASASNDETIKIWQLNGNLLKTIQGHGEAVRDISFSIDGQIIASAGADHTIKLWQLGQDKHLKNNDIRSISFSPDGTNFASASWNGDIKIWQKDTSLVKEFSAHNDIADAVIFSPDGKTLATASADKNIKIWDSNNQQLIKILTSHEDRVTSISFSSDGNLLASGSADNTVKLWDVNSGKLLNTLTGHTDEVTSVNFSSDGNLLASGSADNTVKLWDVNGNLVKNLTSHGLAIASVKFSPDSKLLATASWDNTIKLWRVADGELIHTLTGHTDGVTSLSFNGQTLASGSADNTIRLWSIKDGTLLKTLLGHQGKVNSLSFSPDGKALVSGGDDAGVMVWNLDLDDLMQQGCDRIANYLHHNANVSPGDRLICRND